MVAQVLTLRDCWPGNSRDTMGSAPCEGAGSAGGRRRSHSSVAGRDAVDSEEVAYEGGVTLDLPPQPNANECD